MYIYIYIYILVIRIVTLFCDQERLFKSQEIYNVISCKFLVVISAWC